MAFGDMTRDVEGRPTQKKPEIPARREFLRGSVIGGAAAAAAAALQPLVNAARENSPASVAAEVAPFELDEITIADLQEGMKSGKYSVRAIVEKYLERIEAIDKHGP